ncbi:MAG: hypothetical protein L6R42_000173 [Xanthoria sp. 1 TBL-2021]|nr:MAG: hypothetical protein L6R42_000173 [Xanthoria sp. 1 TBL-2021]
MGFKRTSSEGTTSDPGDPDVKLPNPWSARQGLVSRMKSKKNSDVEDFMVIGIDFGTTYSGAAWATVADFQADQINLITSWPGTGREEGKAPTELFYEDTRLMWGYEIPSDADPIRWFKLLLLREEDLASELRDSEFLLRGRKMLRESEKTAVNLIADYLRALWRHVLDTIQKARGKSVVEGLSFNVVITVPAIWKDYARQGMEEAAREAGILDTRPAGPTTLTFAPEPEAAALASICESGRKVEAGNVFVICDAGGGTVDLISYEVGDKDPIALHEAVVGTGGLCGGVFIDEAFENMVKSRLGRRWNRLTQNGIKEIMKNEWEYAVKPQFKLENDTTKDYIVAVPAEAFEGSSLNDDSKKPFIKRGRIHFASSDVQKAFASPFRGIEALVDGQINKITERSLTVTGIILVGGLGSSPYLYQHLRRRYEGKKIEVLQSTGIRPRTAICRGAIFKGFLDAPSTEQANKEAPNISVRSKVSVVSTIARLSLGVAFDEDFEEGKHRPEDRYRNKLEGVWRARNQMEWYVRKGDNVSKAQPKKNNFYRSYGTSKDFTGSMRDIIFQCDEDDPPSRLTKGIQELCSIKCDLDIPYDALEDLEGAGGRKLKKFEYDIEMIPSGASNEFSILYKGERLASQNARIEFQ